MELIRTEKRFFHHEIFPPVIDACHLSHDFMIRYIISCLPVDICNYSKSDVVWFNI